MPREGQGRAERCPGALNDASFELTMDRSLETGLDPQRGPKVVRRGLTYFWKQRGAQVFI